MWELCLFEDVNLTSFFCNLFIQLHVCGLVDSNLCEAILLNYIVKFVYHFGKICSNFIIIRIVREHLFAILSICLFGFKYEMNVKPRI